MVALKLELAGLRSEREKAAEVARRARARHGQGPPVRGGGGRGAGRDRRAATGDDCDAVGDFRGGGGRKGDVVVDIDGCAGAVARPDRVRGQELAALAQGGAGRARGARWRSAPPTTASGSCRPRTSCPRGRTALREVGGDKLFVVYDPEDGLALALEVAYSLARARVLMAKGGVDGLDAPALRAEVERALGAMDEVRRIKLHLTNAAGGIEQARAVLEGMAERVRAHLAADLHAGRRGRRRLALRARLRSENRPEGDSPVRTAHALGVRTCPVGARPRQARVALGDEARAPWQRAPRWSAGGGTRRRGGAGHGARRRRGRRASAPPRPRERSLGSLSGKFVNARAAGERQRATRARE